MLYGLLKQEKDGLFGPISTVTVNDNGIEGLDRIIRSNRISPDIITDYTRVALRGRLEVLQGYSGSKEQYKEIQKQYLQIINLSKQVYDMVIVDIDRKLDNKTKIELINQTDVIVAMTTQKLDNLEKLQRAIADGSLLKKENTIITLGKYDEKSRFNMKNISRNIIRMKDMVNTVPYNSVLFDDTQEGKIIDMFIRFLSLTDKDENTFFVDEIKRLKETIDQKEKLVKQMGK